MLNKDGAETNTTCEIIQDQPQDDNNDDSKPKVSFILTMFNIMCSAVGIGVLFLPSTLCGAGWPLGIAMILIIGLAADWSSRALVEATCKSKSKSLEDMFRKVLGPWAGHLYSISVFLLLIGALSIFILIMGMQVNDLIASYLPKDTKETTFLSITIPIPIPFRILSITFSLICGVSLFLRNLKVLSYVSIVKIAVMIFILIVAISFAYPEYHRRRVIADTNNVRVGSFAEEFPFTPTLLGFMKAMGSWQTAYLFHMGVSDMYFSMENRSYSRWSKVSRISCLSIAILNICFGMVGYFATADQLIQSPDAKDLCEDGGIFLSLYHKGDNNILRSILIQASRYLIVFILMASYPLIFYFLKEYTLLIIENLFKKSVNKNVVTLSVWLLILCTSCTIANPFAVTDLIVSIVGTIAVFLMPVLCWVQINGGFGYIFTLGLFNDYQRHEANKQIIDVSSRDNRIKSHSNASTNEETQVFKSNDDKPSIISMLSAQFVFWLSCAFIIIGVSISSMEIYQNNIAGRGGIGWRQSIFDYPRSASA